MNRGPAGAFRRPDSNSHDVLRGPAGTCRDRLRQVLDGLDGRGAVTRDEICEALEGSSCTQGHDLHYAVLMGGLVDVDHNGAARLSRKGVDWLDQEGRPSPSWTRSVVAGASPLRPWQDQALRSWAGHARRGVVEAVTGTGKSRVGVEATREALSHDYSVVIVVPTRDLVEQWVSTLRAHKVPKVGVVGGGRADTLLSHRVLVGTVQSLYLDPPLREDGKVLLVADECHRYGAGQWRQVLHSSYRRRLGLTATFERSDEGLAALLTYFGGSPVFRIGFDQAIADGVVAHYDVKLHGVPLDAVERQAYDQAHDTVVDSRMHLLAANFPADPFGLFLHRVQEAAEDADGCEDPTVVDMARRYLKAFSERIQIVSSARSKMDAVRRLAPRVTDSHGALLFTRTVDAADEISETLVDAGVACQPIHSRLTPTERRERLAALKAGRLKAVAAPTVLDEGVDVPVVDLAVVLGGSRSRRQMIQRMGRVLRLKPHGGKATFIVVYAIHTVEDLTLNDGREGCLDLIIRSADSVERLTTETLATSAESAPKSPPAPAAALVTGAAPMAITDQVLNEFRAAHPSDAEQAAPMLQSTVEDFWRLRGPVGHEMSSNPPWRLENAGIDLLVDALQVLRYRCWRPDRLPWPKTKIMLARTRSERAPEGWAARPQVGSTPRSVNAILNAARPLGQLVIGADALELHRQCHGGSVEEARAHVSALLHDLEHDLGTCLIDGGARLVVGRSGYSLAIEAKGNLVVGYSSSGQRRTYTDYVDLGRGPDTVKDLPGEPVAEDPLEISDPGDLLDYIDFATVYLPAQTMRAAQPVADRGQFNPWDLDRSLRSQLLNDVAQAESVEHTVDGQHVVRGTSLCWAFRADGLVASVIDPATPTSPTAADQEPAQANQDRQESVPAPPADDPADTKRGSAGPTSVVGELERLVALRVAGHLTDNEFSAAKARLLR